MTDPFWIEDWTIIIEKTRLVDFFPSENQTMIEKYNSIVRLCLYISILTSVYNNDLMYMGIFILSLLITYYLYKTQQPEQFEQAQNEECYKPTLNNPFMNLNYTEFDNKGNITRPPACNSDDVKKDIDAFFSNNLYRDTTDLFGKMNSQRQFFTMPYTTVPNDPNGDFKNWLYKSPKTCKEDTEYCTGRNEDTRRNFKRV